MPALTYLLYFPQWWFINRSKWWKVFISRTLLINVDRTAIVPQLKSLFSPYHNDRSIVGRGIGFLMRMVSVLIGLAVLLVVTFALLLAYFAWLMWPFSVFWGIRFGGWAILWGLLLTLTAFLFYWLGCVLQPKYTLQQLVEDTVDGLPPTLPSGVELREYASGNARKILRNLPQSFSTGVLMRMLAADADVLRLFKRMELTDEQLLSRIAQQSSNQSQVVNQDDLAEAAIAQALHHHHRYITTPDIFFGLVAVSPLVTQILTDLGVRREELEQASTCIESETQHKGGWRW